MPEIGQLDNGQSRRQMIPHHCGETRRVISGGLRRHALGDASSDAIVIPSVIQAYASVTRSRSATASRRLSDPICLRSWGLIILFLARAPRLPFLQCVA
jgi:hypothetical protein